MILPINSTQLYKFRTIVYELHSFKFIVSLTQWWFLKRTDSGNKTSALPALLYTLEEASAKRYIAVGKVSKAGRK